MLAVPSLPAFGTLVECPPHVFWITRSEDDVPKAVGHAVTEMNAAGAVMIEMVAAGVAEVRVTKSIEVHAVVNPLRDDITLHIAGQHHRQRVHRRDKTKRSGNDEQRQQVLQSPAYVVSVERVCMVAVVDRIENPVQVMIEPWLVLKLVVKEPAMCQVLDECV